MRINIEGKLSPGVSANDGHSWLSQPIFWSDNVNDSVFFISQSIMSQTELTGIGGECLYLIARNRVGNRLILI